MKINPERLSSLRQKNHMTRKELAERSGIAERTIQRLENEPEKSQKTREDTLNRLAKALGVEPGVLTGELPLPESDKAPAFDSERVQIGAQTVPKFRLAYDLIKRRYGVSATEIINMAPLFFALLAEGSLAWRREKLREVEEMKRRLEQIDGFWRGGTLGWVEEGTLRDEGVEGEEDSIAKADLFGEHLISDTSIYNFFDPSTDNPFASYLRKLKAELDITNVNVEDGDLGFGSPLRFPDYDICRDELDSIANGSTNAKRALEIGYARLSEIPEELMAEDAGEERAKWLEERLPDSFKEKEIEDSAEIEKIKDIGAKAPEKALEKLEELFSKREEKMKENRCAEDKARSASLSGTDPEGASKDIEEANSQETNSNTEKGGDDQ